jgi:hypothetical protein
MTRSLNGAVLFGRGRQHLLLAPLLFESRIYFASGKKADLPKGDPFV